jgi:polyisoprenoid-binding protein YceI
MKRVTIFSAHLLGAVWLAAGSAAAETYTFDKEHTKIVFVYNHLGMSNQYGRFDSFDGEVEFNAEKMNTSRASVSIDVASIDTDVAKLDEHLRSEEFFDAAKHPKITFKSTEVRQTGAKTMQIAGDLTIKGKTRPVVLDATFNFIGEHPLAKFVKAYAGVQYASFSAKTRIRRSEFDVGLYAPLTSDTIDIVIETELRKK